jgi:hypothetical protein
MEQNLRTRAQKSYASKLSYYQNKRRHEFWRFISVRYKEMSEMLPGEVACNCRGGRTSCRVSVMVHERQEQTVEK